MSLDLGAVRTALAARARKIPGLQAYNKVPAKPEAPCAIVHVTTVDPHATLSGGAANVVVQVQVLVQLADWDAAQDALDSYCTLGTPTSMVDALEDDADGVCETEVTMIENFGHVALGDPQNAEDYASVTFTCNVYVG